MKRRRSTKRSQLQRTTNQAMWLGGEDGISQPSDNIDIGRDLIFEILARLPIKCLLRVKAVSKYWYRLISGPEFIKFRLQFACDDPRCADHKLLQISRYIGLIFNQAPLLPTLSDPESFPMNPTGIPHPMKFSFEENCTVGVDFVGSCRGVVCIASVDHRVIVWNPTLRKSKRLPYFGSSGFDVFFGFGYDESSDDFKVVGIRNTPTTSVKIYSARTNSWKKLDLCKFEVGWVDSHGCFLNGKLHWAVQDNKSIFTVDLSTERFSVMEPPAFVLSQECHSWSVYSVGQFLAVFCFYKPTSPIRLRQADFFVMGRYGVKESWTRVNNGSTTGRDYAFLHREREMGTHVMYGISSGPGEAWQTIPVPGHMTGNAIKAYLLYRLKCGGYPYDNLEEFFLCFERHRLKITLYVESLIWPFLK